MIVRVLIRRQFHREVHRKERLREVIILHARSDRLRPAEMISQLDIHCCQGMQECLQERSIGGQTQANRLTSFPVWRVRSVSGKSRWNKQEKMVSVTRERERERISYMNREYKSIASSLTCLSLFLLSSFSLLDRWQQTLTSSLNRLNVRYLHVRLFAGSFPLIDRGDI